MSSKNVVLKRLGQSKALLNPKYRTEIDGLLTERSGATWLPTLKSSISDDGNIFIVTGAFSVFTGEKAKQSLFHRDCVLF